MMRHVPTEVASGEKQGFSAPDASWFRKGSVQLIEKKLMSKEARIYEFLDPEAVQAFVGEHMSGQKNRRLFIWSLLNLEALLDQ